MKRFLLTVVLGSAGLAFAADIPLKRDPLPVAAGVDAAIDRRLKEDKTPASPSCDDAEFIRRLSLDLRGRVPTADRVSKFLGDSDPAKRGKLIDEFLSDSEYGEHFGVIWFHRIAKPNMDNQGLLSKSFQQWLAGRFNKNDGWDKIVHDILTAEGEREKNPAIVFWLAQVEGNAKRSVMPNKVTAAASQLFLGVRLECCECHNHPFDKSLKQTDFWGMSAFFTAIHADGVAKGQIKAGNEKFSIQENTRPVQPNRKEANREVASFGSIVIPDSKGKTVKAGYLHEPEKQVSTSGKLRPAFADWMTSPSNPYFARAAVNKVWANFFGRGLVNPVDDMREDSVNTHPAVLDSLTREFVASGFDQKHLIRCICNTKAYQRTSKPLPGNKSDDKLYSHMTPRAMSADMLYDSLGLVLGHDVAERERGGGKGGAIKQRGGDARDRFRAFFHAEADDDAGFVEDYTHGIPQVLRLMNAQQMNNTNAVVERLVKANSDPHKVIEGLYLRVLARHPTKAETDRAMGFVKAGGKESTKSYGELMWVLLNTGEFLFNH